MLHAHAHDITVAIFDIAIFILCYMFGLSFHGNTVFGSVFMTGCTSDSTGNLVIKKATKQKKKEKEKKWKAPGFPLIS